MLENPKSLRYYQGNNTEDVTMDNQQRRLMRLGWAGGIIDGEGNISVTHTFVSQKGHHVCYPRVKVCNTNQVLMDELADILQSEGLAFWRGRPNAKVRNINHKPQELIGINGIKRVKRFLDVMRPYLVAKRDVADVVKQFIDRRLSRPYHCALDEMDIALIEQVRKLNERGTASFRSETNTPATIPAEMVMIEPVPVGKPSGREAVRHALLACSF